MGGGKTVAAILQLVAPIMMLPPDHDIIKPDFSPLSLISPHYHGYIFVRVT